MSDREQRPTRTVTVWGGPDDGKQITVPVGVHFVQMVEPGAVTARFFPEPEMPRTRGDMVVTLAPARRIPDSAPLNTRTVPIVRGYSGRWFALWHDPR